MSDEAQVQEQPCRWCGALHGPMCPWVKALQFDPTTGVVTRVEFITPADMVREPPAPEPAPDYPRLQPRS